MADDIKEDVQELTDRIFLLREMLDSGKMKIASHLISSVREDLAAIKLRSDGLVDPSTVRGSIRAMALAVRSLNYREDVKRQIGLHEIQAEYFDFLYREFGELYRLMLKSGADPSQAAEVLSRNDELCKSTVEQFPSMAEALKEFWSNVGDSSDFHLQDGDQLKAAFAGDIFPAHWENVISTAGLYIDTLVLPCPFCRMLHLSSRLESTQFVKVLLKHVFTAMSYRDAALLEVEPPLVVIAPNVKDIALEDKEALAADSEILTLKHAGYLFGRDFESRDMLFDFCSSLEAEDSLLSELKGVDRFVIDSDAPRDVRSQFRSIQYPVSGITQDGHAGKNLLVNLFGRMPQALAAQRNAIRVGGTPLIGAEASWLHYSWMLEYQSHDIKYSEKDREAMHVARALSAESGNHLAWLGNVPVESVMDIRRRGLANEVRGIIGQGISDLIGLSSEDYVRSTDQVIDNLDRAFRQHQREILKAKQEKLKFYGLDVASCIAVGGVAVAAAITANPALGAVSGVLGVLGLSNFKDVRTKYKALAEQERKRQVSPTGIMFRHVK
ncbi:hypothetical protein [Pseudomonas soli]|uniref:hypothetical protein n=1 Tax=Pseudomonas soli TaxID=1306993 RepID=UPI00381CA5E4